MQNLDLIIKNARVARPTQAGVDCLDIAIKDGKVGAACARNSGRRGQAEYSTPARLLAFPGCVDAHMHVGIYQPLAEDAVRRARLRRWAA